VSPHRALALSVAVLSLAVASFASALPISELHENTSTGLPNKTGFFFDVTGIVTSPDGVRSATSTDVYIQDATGGVDLFLSGGVGAFHFALGDSVSIRGQVTSFNGLTELTALSNYVFHSGGNLAVDPLVMTCAQLNASFVVSSVDSFPEPNEGRLVRINNVTRVSGTWPVTCPGANVSITIQDATGTALLFIDKDSEVCGSSDPSGPFDVIGILSQFDSASPYNTGYELVPRFESDIIPLTPGPHFTTTPQAVDIDSVSARITWTTDVVSSSLVEYGLTTAYGSAMGDSTPVTDHSVQLSGLTPGKLYHFIAASSDVNGTRVSADLLFVTPSSAPGAENFYFNKSIDASLARGEVAQGGVYLLTPVLNRVNSATHDISVAIYSFNISALADALIAAKNRGVLVRLILDADAAQTQADRLRAAGIPVITSTYGGNHLSGGIHHNKFFVFDGRDAETANDWVWTGSINMSNENMGDANNGFEIQDFGLAQAYLTEFNEEWGSATDTPNSATSRMGNRKTDNTPHQFVINGKNVELYFSPSDGTESHIVSAVNSADSSAYFALLVFTSNALETALKAKHDNVPGFAVRGVFDASGINNQGSAWPAMTGSGAGAWAPPADVWSDVEGFLIHHKYCIIDEGHPTMDPIVTTGSHNWSAAANNDNDENELIFHDQRVANLFVQEFAQRYHISGGTADLHVVDAGDVRVASGLRLAAPYPNPAATGATVEFSLPGGIASGQRMSLGLYDLQGRRVKTLLDGPAVAGPQRVSLRAQDGSGARLASGVYFLRLTALGSQLSQKWVVLQ
jgi:phosphatidylserine/phosphatidylglycerophosphate/cardiolipin synthase-like enzyme